MRASENDNHLLLIQDCSLSFGGVQALSNLSLQLASGDILGIIGPNGAGKTTLFNLLTGIYQPTHGDLQFRNTSLVRLAPFEIARLGIARTFQNIRLFQNLTVEENVQLAFYAHSQSSLFASLLQTAKVRREKKQLSERAQQWLARFGLSDKSDELAKNLSYGNQRKLEMIRALVTQPQLLLLDEPAAGMNLTEKEQLAELIRTIHQELKISILLIEHDIAMVASLCPKILVLNYGSQLAFGPPDEVRQNPEVIEAYLGKRRDRA